MVGPRVITVGTPRDLADSGVGYVSSGESQWSRDAASSGAGAQREPPESAKGHFTDPRPDLIFRNRQEIRRLVRRMDAETDPVKLAKLRKNYSIKSMFLAKLETQKARAAASA